MTEIKWGHNNDIKKKKSWDLKERENKKTATKGIKKILTRASDQTASQISERNDIPSTSESQISTRNGKTRKIGRASCRERVCAIV